MNIFFSIWSTLVWQPQINLLYLFFNQFGDIGYSLVAVAIVANIPLLFLYAKSYINIQKTRILSPQIQSIQKKYKEDPLEMRKQTMAFYKKHSVNNSAMIYMILFQLFFVTGLFYIVIELQKGVPVGGIYSFLRSDGQFLFPVTAFGWLNITESIKSHIWILILNAILSFFYGFYSFKIAPQIKMPVSPDRTQEEIDQAKTMEKSQVFMGVYFTPILLSIINFNLPVGVNIYAVVASFLSLTRQVIITNFYAKETKLLYQQIIESDPSVKETAELTETQISSLSDNSPIVELVEIQPKNKKSKKIVKKNLKINKKNK